MRMKNGKNEDENASGPGPEHPMLAKQSAEDANKQNAKEASESESRKAEETKTRKQEANDNRGQSIPCSEWRPRRKKSKKQNARKRKTKSKIKSKTKQIPNKPDLSDARISIQRSRVWKNAQVVSSRFCHKWINQIRYAGVSAPAHALRWSLLRTLRETASFWRSP